jgi:microcompartment protein CcmL/EutN
MDVTTISALAAAGAAVGAFSVAGVQLYVGHRQPEAALKAANAALMNAQSAGRHTVAVFGRVGSIKSSMRSATTTQS